MTRILALAAALGLLASATASAAPPTATPSPGYDARLQQQHALQSSEAAVHQPAMRYSAPTHRHVRHIHERIH